MGDPVRGIEQRPAFTQDLRALLPADHALAKRRRLRIRDLVDLPYVGLQGDTRSHSCISELFRDEGVALRATISVDDFDTASVFVELGLGYAIVPAVQAANFARNGKLVPIPIKGVKPIAIGWAARRWSSLSVVARAFVELFREEVVAMKEVRVESIRNPTKDQP